MCSPHHDELMNSLARTVTLRPLTADNWVAVARLQIADEQADFLTPNVWSIARLQFESHYVARTVYAAEEPVGFATKPGTRRVTSSREFPYKTSGSRDSYVI